MLNVLILFICLFVHFCYGDSEYLTLPEGSKCTWKGAIGTCVPIYRCLSAEEYIFMKKEHPPICEYQGKEPVICCVDCSLVDDTRLITFHRTLGFLVKNGRKAHDKCIDYITDKNPCNYDSISIGYNWRLNTKTNCYNAQRFAVSPAGGKPARRNEYPHMALLGYGSDVPSLQWLCGGSLISHNFVLTAAHCISEPVLGPVTYVALGILRRSDPPQLWQRYKVKSIIPHPGYKSPSKYHDIALLQTSKPVVFGDVWPACLHVDGDLDEQATATGWGAVGHRKDISDTLLSVKLEKYTDEECMENYPPHRHLRNGFNSSTQMCYGDRTGIQDTCSGDSGGPLQSKMYYPDYSVIPIFKDWYPKHCVFTILGVTSYGKPCEEVGNSGIYTKVLYYVPWIESIVWP